MFSKLILPGTAGAQRFSFSLSQKFHRVFSKLPDPWLVRAAALTGIAIAGALALNFQSLNIHLALPIRQLHVAWNLTRILIEF